MVFWYRAFISSTTNILPSPPHTVLLFTFRLPLARSSSLFLPYYHYSVVSVSLFVFLVSVSLILSVSLPPFIYKDWQALVTTSVSKINAHEEVNFILHYLFIQGKPRKQFLNFYLIYKSKITWWTRYVPWQGAYFPTVCTLPTPERKAVQEKIHSGTPSGID